MTDTGMPLDSIEEQSAHQYFGQLPPMPPFNIHEELSNTTISTMDSSYDSAFFSSASTIDTWEAPEAEVSLAFGPSGVTMPPMHFDRSHSPTASKMEAGIRGQSVMDGQQQKLSAMQQAKLRAMAKTGRAGRSTLVNPPGRHMPQGTGSKLMQSPTHSPSTRRARPATGLDAETAEALRQARKLSAGSAENGMIDYQGISKLLAANCNNEEVLQIISQLKRKAMETPPPDAPAPLQRRCASVDSLPKIHITSNGMPLPHDSNDGSPQASPAPMSPTYDQDRLDAKIIQRKERNREIARKSRQRKKMYIQAMEDRLRRLEQAHNTAMQGMQMLAQENGILKHETERLSGQVSQLESENSTLRARVQTLSPAEAAAAARAMEESLLAGTGSDVSSPNTQLSNANMARGNSGVSDSDMQDIDLSAFGLS